MGPLSKTSASLRFFGEDLDPDEVTALLGQPPTRAWRKGDLISVSEGVDHRRRRGTWSRQVDPRTPGDLDAQIEKLLSGLTDDMEVWRALSERFGGNIFCGLFMQESNEAEDLSPNTMLAIGLRGLELQLDIYGPGD